MIAEVDRAQPALDFMGIGEAQTAAEKIRVATGGLVNQLGRLRALAVEFYERRGHIALGYSSIEECAKREFGWHRTTFWRALQTATIERQLGVTVGTLPGSHAAALKRLPAADRAEAYTAAGAGATAADVRAEVARRLLQEDRIPDTEPPDYQEDTPAAPGVDLCEHDNPIEGYCRECEDAYIDREERRLENLPEVQPPLTVCAYCGRPGAGAVLDGEPWCGDCEELAGVVTETVGSRPAPQSRVAANGEAGATSAPVARPNDRRPHGTTDEDWTAGMIERAFFEKRGMSLADALRVARAVVETAENPDAGSRRRMAARAWLKGEVG